MGDIQAVDWQDCTCTFLTRRPYGPETDRRKPCAELRDQYGRLCGIVLRDNDADLRAFIERTFPGISYYVGP